ncbi:lipoprotein [Streptomyces monomycini]|uniref:lipoprotein n=1 Tax=Streptomyces monomycini TaxID=371720 RepID=UPI0004AAD88F|nr:lipoprotein [Streptomyces monomycini]
MRKDKWGAVSVVLAIGVLAGCSSTADKGGDAAKGASPSVAASAPANAAKGDEKAKADKADAWKKGTRIGAAGTACELPVSFDVAKAWKPKGLSADDGELLAQLMGRTSVRGACEIDAKPAGNIGFIRVWTADGTKKSPRQVLEAFTAEEKGVDKKEISDIKVGGLPAAEVSYTSKSPIRDEPQQERAFAVVTPKGATVVHLGGFDNTEHKEMLPAYELAKKTVAPVS